MTDLCFLMAALDFEATIYPGWFSDTLPRAAAALAPIGLLHLDCDWYTSVRCCLTHFWPLVIPGGYVVLDDAGYWPATQVALQEVVGNVPLRWTDHTGAWFQRPSERRPA